MATPTPTPTITLTPTPSTSMLYPVIQNVYELDFPPEIDPLSLKSSTRLPRPESFSGQVGLLSCYVLGNPQPTPSPSLFSDSFISWYKTHEKTSFSLSFEGIESTITYCSCSALVEGI